MELAREEEAMSLFSEEIVTMKKKIQLSEGQRRAEYEEFEAEKRRITNQIRKLKKEIREISSAKPSKFVDIEALKKSGVSIKELKVLEGKTPEEVIEILDLQCIDLQKKIDLTKYDIGKKKERYATSLKQMKELAEEHDTEFIMPLNGTDGLIKLENKIHEASLHVLEMRHLERKYSKMRQSLMDDRVFFQTTLDKYQEEITKQAKEIQHLQGVRDEAIRLRDKTRRKLAKLEEQVIAQGVEREQQLHELKKKVEEGRAYLEKVERSLVPTNKGLIQPDSGEIDDIGQTAQQQAKDSLQSKLHHLKEVTSAKDEEDIIQKLQTQKMTKERLLKLKNSIENEKKKLEMKKEQLEAELEAVKFADVKEKEQNEEEYEKHEKALKEAKEEIATAKEKCEKEKRQLIELKDQIKSLCHSLQSVNQERLPDSDDDVFLEEVDNNYLDQLINVTKSKFNDMISKFKEMDLQAFSKEPLSDLYLDTGLIEDTSGAKKLESDKEGEKTIEDLPDIPSRDYLKRQSQLLVEAQGKRKGYPKEGSSFR